MGGYYIDDKRFFKGFEEIEPGKRVEGYWYEDNLIGDQE